VLNSDPGTERVEREAVGAPSAADERKARNEIVFREVNERIAELTGEWNVTGVSLIICECSDQHCAEALEITSTEYEQVRADGARFVVLVGHQLPEQERVVDGNDRFLVVEKVGPAATLARAADPRRRG
jgi:hypothetical protein